MAKYKTVGIKPKFDFRDTVGTTLTGTYLGRETVQNPKAKKESDKTFTVWVVADEVGRNFTLSGGHLDYLFEKAIKEEHLTEGQGVRITFLGWSEMDDGNKARKYNLELEEAD